jgi:predicted RNase H-like nuclease (RuvC/YqgF family)
MSPTEAKAKEKEKEKEKEKAEPTPLEAFVQTARAEHEQIRTEMKEIGLLVEQSQGEVDKLAQRNAGITAHVHQLTTHFDTVPRKTSARPTRPFRTPSSVCSPCAASWKSCKATRRT